MSLHNLCIAHLCHTAHWGDAAKVLVLISRVYLCFRKSLCLNASGLQAFAFRKKSWIQRQRHSLKLHRASGWVLSASKPKAPYSSVSPHISGYGWSGGLKGPCPMQRGRLLGGKRLSHVSAGLCFDGSIFELTKPSLPKLPILPH